MINVASVGSGCCHTSDSRGPGGLNSLEQQGYTGSSEMQHPAILQTDRIIASYVNNYNPY